MKQKIGIIGKAPLFLPVAADDAKAKDAVLQIEKDIGFDPVDAGTLANSRLLESLCYLNIQLGYVINKGIGSDIGFSLVR